MTEVALSLLISVSWEEVEDELPDLMYRYREKTLKQHHLNVWP